MRGGSPDWVRDGLIQFRDELRLFAETLARSALHPRAFARAWLRGDAHSLNPFGYVLTAIGLVGGVRTLTSALTTQKTDDGSLGQQILAAASPPAYFLALGLAAHAVIVLSGLRGVRVRETAALALYAAGPALVGHAVVVCLVIGLAKARLIGVADGIAAVGTVASLVAFVVPFVASLRELHAGARAPWLRSIVAFGVVFALSGLFFGAVRPRGHYGLHPTLRPPGATNAHWAFSFGSTVF